MSDVTRILTGMACAIAITAIASPAVAGHKHGGFHKHGSYMKHGGSNNFGYQQHSGYAKRHGYGHRMHPRWMAKRHHGWHRHGNYGMPGGYGPMGYGAMSHGKGGHGPTGMYKSAADKPQYGSGKTAGSYDAGNLTGAKPKTSQATGDIVATASAAGSFSTLIAAVEAADLVTTLQGEGPFTVLAPNDAAFAKLAEGTLDGLLQDPDALSSVLTYHVIPGRLTAADLVEAGEATTVNGDVVTLAQLDVADADVEASNGIIHVLDTVLIPSS